MPITLLTSFLGSTAGKYAMIAIAFLGIIFYFKTTIWALELSISSLENDVKSLSVDLRTSESNTKSCLNTNAKNVLTLNEYKTDVEELNRYNKMIVNSKNKEVSNLKKILKSYKEPIYYPREITMKECKLKIKTKEDINETDFNFITFTSIGW